MLVYLTHIPSPLNSILLAIFTVSPNKQYLGMVRPTTPAAQPPLCHYAAINDNLVCAEPTQILQYTTWTIK